VNRWAVAIVAGDDATFGVTLGDAALTTAAVHACAWCVCERFSVYRHWVGVLRCV